MKNRRPAGERGVIIAFCLIFAAVALSLFLTTVYAAHSYTVYEETADGEALAYPNGTYGYNLTNSYTYTQVNDNNFETIEKWNGSLIWDYYFNTNYNMTQPARIEIIVDAKSTSESTDIKIYNYSSNSWIYTSQHPISYFFSTIYLNLTWKTYNLSEFFNHSGKAQILFEDTERATGGLQIDYLALNVTVSPHYAFYLNLTNSTSGQTFEGANLSRADSLNISALWNASGLVESYVVMNSTGSWVEYNYSSAGLSGLWTNHTLMNFSNITVFHTAGQIVVKVKAFDTFWQQNVSGVKWFNLWSDSAIGGMGINQSNESVVNGTAFRVDCMVVDNWSQSAIHGYNVSFYVNGSYNGSALTNSTGWASTNIIAPAYSGNYSLVCNITDQAGLFYIASGDNSGTTGFGVIVDTDTPSVNSAWAMESGQVGSIFQTNICHNVTFYANITDATSSITSATLYVTKPDGINISGAMHPESGLWAACIDACSASGLNMSGEYNISAEAWDIAGNYNFSGVLSFLVVNANYGVTLVDSVPALYNRGENLTLFTTSNQGFPQSGVNWTIFLIRYGESAQNITQDNGTYYPGVYFNYTIDHTAPTGEWILNVTNVTKNGNGWNGTFAFNVTSTIIPYKTHPTSSVAASSAFELRALINLSRGGNLPWNVTINANCLNSTNEAANVTMNWTGSYYTNSSCYSAACGSSTTVYLYVYDGHNNTGTTAVTVSSASCPSTNPPSGGTVTLSGPAAPFGGAAPAVCNCTAWTSQSCESGGCGAGEMYQTRVCSPTGCKNESQCIASPACSKKASFTLNAAPEQMELEQGSSSAFMLMLDNTGGLNVSLSVGVSGECCETFFQKSAMLAEGAEINMPVKIRVPLSKAAGSYMLTVSASGGGIERSKVVKIAVKLNKHVEELENMTESLKELENEIISLENTGVDTALVRVMMANATAALKTANNGISADNNAMLDASMEKLRLAVGDVQITVESIRTRRMLETLAPYVAAGLVLVVAVTFIRGQSRAGARKRSEIKRLQEKYNENEEIIKNTERQFYKRAIDQKTYMKIMAEKKSERITLMSEIENNKKQMASESVISKVFSKAPKERPADKQQVPQEERPAEAAGQAPEKEPEAPAAEPQKERPADKQQVPQEERPAPDSLPEPRKPERKKQKKVSEDEKEDGGDDEVEVVDL